MMLAKFETVRCSGSSMYTRSMRIPQLALLLEVQPVTLFIAFNEHTEEAEEKLQVLFASAAARMD